MKTEMRQKIKTVYEKHKDAFFQYAISFVHDSGDAQDVVHSSIEKLMEYGLENGCLPYFVKSYVFRCIKNQALDVLRKRNNKRDVELEIKHIWNGYLATEKNDDLQRCFASLKEEQKEVIMLKVIMGYTHFEISQIKGVPVFTVSSWYRRGINDLRQKLKRASKK